MRQVQIFKALRPVPRSKRLRLEREERAFDRDCQVAYAAMLQRVTEHNARVFTGLYAPRASPSVH